MIGFLTGKVTHTFEDSMIILCGEVGYELFVRTEEVLNIELGNKYSFFIYTHVRPEQIQLYGFSSLSEKSIFLSLIKISGIGPKMAMKILSGTSVERFRELVDNSDVKGLSALPKVGKKTAEQIILSLKGSWPKEDSLEMRSPIKRQIVTALVNLGFRENEVEEVVSSFSGQIEFDDGIRDGLAMLRGANR